MTFVAVSAGQLIKASITNANLRHVGRLGDPLAPMDTAGVTTDGVQDLGTASAQHKDIYLTGKIYVNGTEFKGGGGGGGGLTDAENQSHKEKTGISYPLSDPGICNESYTNSANIVITPRKAYTATETTMVFDYNKTDIDLCNATTGWTGGKTTGTSATLATDTTAGEFLEGTASNKLTINAVSDLAWMKKDQTAFSLVDNLFTLSMYLDNVPAGLVKVSIRLSSVAGGATLYKEYDIPAANLVAGAGTFNHFSIDVNNDTPDDTDGTYNPAATIATHIYFTFNASSTMLAAVDYLVYQPNWLLPVPYKTRIFDATNVEWLYVDAVAGTGYHQRRMYTVKALTNSYAVSTTYAKQRNVTISGNQGVFPGGLAGAVAKVVHDIKTYWLPKSVVADIPVSWRFWDEEFKVSALDSTTTTKIYSATDKKAYFKAGDEVILYQKQTNGIMFGSKYNSTIGKNFKILTLSIDSTFSSDEIELTHTGHTNSGADTSYWYIVRYSVKRMAILEAMAANGALAYVTPISIKISGSGISLSETFTNGDTSPGVLPNWVVRTIENYRAYHAPWHIDGNRASCHLNREGGIDSMAYKEMFSSGYFQNKVYQFDITPGYISSCGYSFAGGIALYSQLSASIVSQATRQRYVASSLCIGVGCSIPSANVINPTLQIINNGVLLYDGLIGNGLQNQAIRIKAETIGTILRVKAWLVSGAEPSAWNYNAVMDMAYTTVNNKYLELYAGGDADQSYSNAIWIDNLIIEDKLSYTLSGTVSGTGDKFVDSLEYSKQDTVNQNPVGYQFDAYISGANE